MLVGTIATKLNIFFVPKLYSSLRARLTGCQKSLGYIDNPLFSPRFGPLKEMSLFPTVKNLTWVARSGTKIANSVTAAIRTIQVRMVPGKDSASELSRNLSTQLHTSNKEGSYMVFNAALSASTDPLAALATPRSSNRGLNELSFGILTACPEMQKILSVVEKVAKTRSTVLILGESGTGKELIARAFHSLSGRMGRLVPVNCGAIPEDILESELFGHEKGSFTGAIASRVGRFQLADGGTIFLDEVGEMSPKLQVKLLRVLQERKVDPVGGTKSIDIDVRVVAATNKDLAAEVKAGRFREDLYYRLQVVPVTLPPLREREGDVEILANYFLLRQAEELGRLELSLSPATLNALSSYHWPGNVRELENMIERLAILSDSDQIEPEHLPDYLSEVSATTQIQLADFTLPQRGVDFNTLIDDYENKLISTALNQTGGNKKAAAKLLGLNRTTLVEKIKKKGLEAKIEVSVISDDMTM